MDDDPVDLMVKIVGGVIIAALAIAAVSIILSSSATPEPGEPMYGPLQTFTSMWGTALVLAVPSSLLVLGWILYELGVLSGESRR